MGMGIVNLVGDHSFYNPGFDYHLLFKIVSMHEHTIQFKHFIMSVQFMCRIQRLLQAVSSF